MVNLLRTPFGPVFLSLLLAGLPAWADKDKAREHFKRGMAAYTLDDYETAIAEFERGFREEPDPVFLFNIAQAHRLCHHPTQALDFYRKYLRVLPDARNRADVESQIAALEKTMGNPTDALTPPIVKGRDKPPLAPVEGARPDVRPGEGTPGVPPEGAPGVTAATATEGTFMGPPLPPPRRRSRVGLGIAVGVAGGVLVLGGVTAGAIVGTRDPASMLPVQDARGMQ